MTAPRAETTVRDATTRVPVAAPRPSFAAAVSAVYAGQLSRARVARGPLLFVATLQSLGILLLMRGVVHGGRTTTASAIVAGSTVLVVAFVALNLLAQRFGALRAGGALDYYAALPVSAAAVVLGTAASYATFTVPGALVTAVAGAALYGLPFAHLWLVLPAVVAAGVALSGIGAALGLGLPRPELATVAGQLGMTLVLFLGVIPPGNLPWLVRGLRQAVPSTYAVDVIAAALRGSPSLGGVLWRLGACLAYGAAVLALSGALFRRAVAR